jgi:hypothetical protein
MSAPDRYSGAFAAAHSAAAIRRQNALTTGLGWTTQWSDSQTEARTRRSPSGCGEIVPNIGNNRARAVVGHLVSDNARPASLATLRCVSGRTRLDQQVSCRRTPGGRFGLTSVAGLPNVLHAPRDAGRRQAGRPEGEATRKNGSKLALSRCTLVWSAQTGCRTPQGGRPEGHLRTTFADDLHRL